MGTFLLDYGGGCLFKIPVNFGFLYLIQKQPIGQMNVDKQAIQIHLNTHTLDTRSI